MKSLTILAAFATLLVFAGCSTSSPVSNRMLADKETKAVRCTAGGDQEQEGILKVREVRPCGDCEGEAGKSGCCEEGKDDVNKAGKADCCQTKDDSAKCPARKKEPEAGQSVDKR